MLISARQPTAVITEGNRKIRVSGSRLTQVREKARRGKGVGNISKHKPSDLIVVYTVFCQE